MDIRVGVTDNSKELEIPVPDDTDPESVRKQVNEAIADGGLLWLTDRRGRQVGVPTSKVAYVEIGTPASERKVGFGG